MVLQRGTRVKLSQFMDDERGAVLRLRAAGQATYDCTCFGTDANGKLAGDAYMTFYNQPATPCGGVRWSEVPGGVDFTLDLSKLPAGIVKLAFTVSIDGAGTMGQASSCSFELVQDGAVKAECALSGSEFNSETAVIALEIYRKPDWRACAVMRGFNGGLGDLLRYYGGEELTSTAPPDPPQKTEKISLKKGQTVSLSKNSGQPIWVENGWTAAGKDYDLKALVRYRDGRLIYVGAANVDEALSTPEGAVRHGGDVRAPGELEHITVSWHPAIASVAVSSYSALENGTGSFHRYGVFVRIKNGNQTVEIPAASTSENDKSYTLCFGEILFGTEKDSLEVSALEMYSRPGSEHRIGYRNGVVVMDIGPEGRTK